MSATVLKEGTVSFTAEGRLLQELGLRLVASPEVALVELIKNAYDADSPYCNVQLRAEGKQLIVSDHGHGMSYDDFATKWMHIATSSKSSQSRSPLFGRPLTGAKGIGRFAVRYLGDHLTLNSTAFDERRGYRTTLTADFAWPRLDRTADLARSAVPYKLIRAADDAPNGTTLTISRLRSTTDFTASRDLRANVLRIVSPLSGLDRGHLQRSMASSNTDPGFTVLLPGETASSQMNLADIVLKHYWARLTISLRHRTARYTVDFGDSGRPRELVTTVAPFIRKGIFCDVRFFPRRKGVFQGKEVNGRLAWQWVRSNSGIAVVDHGFRLKPYGFPEDDWLWLDLDAAHNRREWRTSIANKHFPIPPEVQSRPADNPALYLPHNWQLVGAVFIETKRSGLAAEERDLVSSMDREGLLTNEGFEQLREVVRAGIEFLAQCDKHELATRDEQAAAALAERAREDIRAAIEEIRDNESLGKSDKAKIIRRYSALSEQLDEQEEYAGKARRSLTTMSLLGVVAGFITHESDAIFHTLNEAINEVDALADRHPSLREASEDLQRRAKAFRAYVDYSRLFIRAARTDRLDPFFVAGQIRHVVNHFRTFADERHIDIRLDIPRDLIGPAVPVVAYSGIVLNLFTNALKAVAVVSSRIETPAVEFRSWDEGDIQHLQVLDNGVGIPSQIRKRIWDPLFSTTDDNPLGSGMGLGLTLVKQVVTELGGSIRVASAAEIGYSTCFHVTLPRR